MHLNLSADDVLATTRAVRKRLDFDRPVPDELIRECVAMAQQSPSGSNNPSMSFMIVKDAKKRKAVGEVYNRCFEQYKTWDGRYIGSIDKGTPEGNAQQQRSASSADFLAPRMGDAPVLVIACNKGARSDGLNGMVGASLMGNILPAMWSFMLAARARGLGTAWTTLHLMQEQAVADIKVFRQLTDADMKFGTVVDGKGTRIELSNATFTTILLDSYAEVRRTAFHRFYDQYQAHANTLAATRRRHGCARARPSQNTGVSTMRLNR
mgnify:CR=1 FL=1